GGCGGMGGGGGGGGGRPRGVCRAPTPGRTNPHPSYNRLSRYDELGLIWLLAGRPVIALTAAGAAIATPTGNTTTYYRRGVAPAAEGHPPISSFLRVANRQAPLGRPVSPGAAARATPSTIPNDQERTNARP